MLHAVSHVQHTQERDIRHRGGHSPSPDTLLPHPFPFFYSPSTPHSADCTGCPWYHSGREARDGLPLPAPKRPRRLPPDTRLHPAEPEPTTRATVTRLTLDPRWYPGVFGVIASHASRDTLLRLRLVSRDARDAADKMLFSHVVVRRKCPGRYHAKMDLAVLMSPTGQRLPLLAMDYSPFAPRPRLSRALKHIRTVDYPSHTVTLPSTLTRQLVSGVQMTRKLGWNYGTLATANQVDVCRSPLRKSLPEALVAMRDVTSRQVMVIPWKESSSGEAPYFSPHTFDLDDVTLQSIRRGGECVIIFRNESGGPGNAVTSPSFSESSSSEGGATQPFLQPLYLLIASLIRTRYTVVGLEDLPRRLMKLSRDPSKEPCAAKRVASAYHLIVAAVCACWNVAAPGEDKRIVEQLIGRLRLMTRAQYRAEVGEKQYALESFDTAVDGPTEQELPMPGDCECGQADCARVDDNADVHLDGDWGEIVRQVMMASAVAKQ
ncbi:hypothetical protein CspeluHIS016_0901780 [Cutaneotrichosporon spelunceum]|uniref:Uncharacterized protein n=1 Tax=Cutaneotrichosporon spelunceum TaxID=1672016 RepID=A0AAD3YEA4_9TREE|nr:hypothetical protein CspeluHIS016_0901780 [Cutaneotrichosporon spelunceum]